MSRFAQRILWWGGEKLNCLLIQLDGKLPNHALLRLSAHLKSKGDGVTFKRISNPRNIEKGLWDDFDKVYASAIFDWTRPLCERLLEIYPSAVIGGSGWNKEATLESLGVTGFGKDYSIYPAYRNSIGYTQRGCRLKCDFCVVPKMEGAVKAAESFLDIWRGDPHPKNVVLMDNDFFGLPTWRENIKAMRDGGFKVSFNQGVNARLFDEESAAAIASVKYYDSDFKTRTIYTAWDSTAHEKPLFRGLNALVRNGVRPDSITVYMLIGNGESASDREYRRARLREFGCRPYPMPFIRTKELVGFQRWIIRRSDVGKNAVSWADYSAANFRPEGVTRPNDSQFELFRVLVS